MSDIDVRNIDGYVHVVKSYAGDSYWRECFKSHGKSDELYYINKYGRRNFDKIISGEQSDMDKKEFSNKKGDYFYDKDGTLFEAT